MKINKKNCGFTLVELLVVIAIISILAGILFPVFASARHQGGGNYLAADGHAKWLPGTKVSNGIDPASSTSPSVNSGYTAVGFDNLTGPGGATDTMTFSNY